MSTLQLILNYPFTPFGANIRHRLSRIIGVPLLPQITFVYFQTYKMLILLKIQAFKLPSPVKIYSPNPSVRHLQSRSLNCAQLPLLWSPFSFIEEVGIQKFQRPGIIYCLVTQMALLCRFMGSLVIVHDKYALSELQFQDNHQAGSPQNN